MSNSSLPTSYALDANSPRPVPVDPLPPRAERKITATERYGVIWTRRLRLSADLLCFGADFPIARNMACGK